MTTARYKSIREDDSLVLDKKAREVERGGAIRRLASDQIYEMEPVFAWLLGGPPPPLVKGAAN